MGRRESKDKEFKRFLTGKPIWFLRICGGFTRPIRARPSTSKVVKNLPLKKPPRRRASFWSPSKRMGEWGGKATTRRGPWNKDWGIEKTPSRGLKLPLGKILPFKTIREIC
jgi:hypothetical protein